MIIQAELKCKQTGCEADPCAVDTPPCWRRSGQILCAEPVSSCEIWTTIQLCRGALLKSAFAAARIPVYDSVLYEGGVALSDYENCIRE